MADCFGPHRAGRIGRTCLSLMLAGLACLPLAAACRRSPSAHEERPATAAEVAPAERSRSFRIVGYVTDKVGTIDNLRYDRLTHINYAFLIPNDDGSVRPLYARRKLSRLVSEAHQHDVKVLLSVGGWGYDAEFEKLAANPESRARLVSEIVRHVQEYDLDGADMDWEYPDPGESAGYFLLLMQELSAAMRAESKLLTAAVVAEVRTPPAYPPRCLIMLISSTSWPTTGPVSITRPTPMPKRPFGTGQAGACRPTSACSACRSTRSRAGSPTGNS